jgi:glycosyltransferase involved in cell wall biosynthesis
MIDILIPCAGSAQFVLETLRSVQAQDLTDYRAWVIDNGCDHTKYKDAVSVLNDVRFTYYRYEKRLPMTENWNRCLRHVSSEYFCFLHDDDIWPATYLCAAVRLINNTKADTVLTAHQKFIGITSPSFSLKASDAEFWTGLATATSEGLLTRAILQPLAHMSALFFRAPVSSFDPATTWMADQTYFITRAISGLTLINSSLVVAIRIQAQSETSSINTARASAEYVMQLRRNLLALLRTKRINSKGLVEACGAIGSGDVLRLVQAACSWPPDPELLNLARVLLSENSIRHRVALYSKNAALLARLPLKAWQVASFFADYSYYRKMRNSL